MIAMLGHFRGLVVGWVLSTSGGPRDLTDKGNSRNGMVDGSFFTMSALGSHRACNAKP